MIHIRARIVWCESVVCSRNESYAVLSAVRKQICELVLPSGGLNVRGRSLNGMKPYQSKLPFPAKVRHHLHMKYENIKTCSHTWDRVCASMAWSAYWDVSWHVVPNVAILISKYKILRRRYKQLQRAAEICPVLCLKGDHSEATQSTAWTSNAYIIEEMKCIQCLIRGVCLRVHMCE